MTGKVFGGVIAVVAIWLVALFVIPSVALALVPERDWATVGQIGDSFGSASALFAGLGSLGVMIVLGFDLKHRKEDYRPFVMVEAKEVKLTRATWDGGPHFSVRVYADIELEGATSAPALNLTMSCQTVDTTSIEGDVVLGDSPLPVGTKRLATVSLEATGVRAEELVSSLGGPGAVLRILVNYDALNSTRWVSRVDFSLRSRVADGELIAKILDRRDAESIEPSSSGAFGTSALIIDAEPVPKTWGQSRI